MTVPKSLGTLIRQGLYKDSGQTGELVEEFVKVCALLGGSVLFERKSPQELTPPLDPPLNLWRRESDGILNVPTTRYQTLLSVQRLRIRESIAFSR
jgi:hypothetical protein